MDRQLESSFSGEESTNPFLREEEPEFFAPVPAHPVSDIIVLPPHATRGEAVATLSRNIDVNQYGLPTYFIRSDLLPSLDGGSVTQDEVDAASVGLHYHEGYPTLSNGSAFWSQLPHEPADAYLLFKRYVDQAEETGIRQLDLLSAQEGVSLDQIRQNYMEFYWSVRSRAFDLFIVAAETKKRQLKTKKMENAHYDQAGKLLEALLQRFEDPDWINELNAKEAIEAVDTLYKVQRLSMGLTGQNASSLPKNPIPEGASVQAMMEHLTRGANLSQEAGDNFTARLQALFTGDDGMQLQDAILRFHRPADSVHTSHDATLGDDM
jgi:hypothetical protein